MKESLQEATQRALLEGYKNLRENKSKKVEVTEDKQDWYYYEIHFDFTEESGKDSDGYSKFFKSSKDVEDDTEYITNLAIEENILDEDDLADIDYIDYAQQIDKEEYERATRTKTEGKKVEGKSNVVSALKEINVSSFQELRDEIEDMLEKEIINEEYEDFLDIISEQEEACEDYIRRRSDVTNTDYEDEIGIESDYVTGAIQDLISFVSKTESKKVETKGESERGYITGEVEAIIDGMTDLDKSQITGKLIDDVVDIVSDGKVNVDADDFDERVTSIVRNMLDSNIKSEGKKVEAKEEISSDTIDEVFDKIVYKDEVVYGKLITGEYADICRADYYERPEDYDDGYRPEYGGSQERLDIANKAYEDGDVYVIDVVNKDDIDDIDYIYAYIYGDEELKEYLKHEFVKFLQVRKSLSERKVVNKKVEAKKYRSNLSVKDLTPEQRSELKQNYLAQKYDKKGKSPSWGELANADNLVTDKELDREYANTVFCDDDFMCSMQENKKVEAKEELSSPDYLEKAFEVEVEYWLKALVDEDSNDEIGKKAQEVLDDKNKMKEIVNELVDGSDDLWEDIHRRIEELAGVHYRESSRVNEGKKVTEAYYYNWKDDIDEVDASSEATDELWYEVAENIKNTDPDYKDWDVYDIMADIISIWKIEKRSRLYDYLIKWYGSEEELLKNVRDVYDKGNAIYFVTGCGYSIWSADLLGGTADGQAERDFDRFVDNGGKR